MENQFWTEEIFFPEKPFLFRAKNAIVSTYIEVGNRLLLAILCTTSNCADLLLKRSTDESVYFPN